MNKSYEKITQVFIDALKNERIPWHKTWTSHRPKNLYSKKEYNGINVLILGLSGEQWFISYRQAQMLGGTINKGAKGLPVVYWNFIEKTNSEGKVEKKIPFLKYSTVFPLSMTSGLESKIPETVNRELKPIESAEAIVKRNNPTMGIGNPSYCPSSDTINMPLIKSFVSAESYYQAFFHELTHWTGSKSRLDRSLSTGFGSEKYSKEELVAEIGSNFLSSECGIECNDVLENSKAYIQSWISKLENEPKLIIEAASLARKASEFLIGKQEEKVEVQTEELETVA